ncbi:MAG: DedA family protein [Thermodesulfobacteriota bacterium]
MSLETLIATYGYAAVAVGTFFEGETILVLGGFAAHRGYLELPWVMLWACLGTLCGDQLYFYLGRIKGTAFLEKRPHWKSRSDRVMALLGKRSFLIMLIFRFLYGLRTVTPFLLGAGGFPPLRFFVFNAVGAVLWAIVIGVLGYLFGQIFEWILGEVEHYELLLFAALAGVGVVVWVWHWVRRWKT